MKETWAQYKYKREGCMMKLTPYLLFPKAWLMLFIMLL